MILKTRCLVLAAAVLVVAGPPKDRPDLGERRPDGKIEQFQVLAGEPR